MQNNHSRAFLHHGFDVADDGRGLIGGWNLRESGDVHQGEIRDVRASNGEDDGLGADGLGVWAEEAVGLGFDLGANLAKVVENLVDDRGA